MSKNNPPKRPGAGLPPPDPDLIAKMSSARPGMSVSRILIGKPLETTDIPHQAISKPMGLAIFASSALSSTAYATQGIFIILSLAGGAAILGLSLPVAIAISSLLIILTISYRQIIYAYPKGGGEYFIARDNLGELTSQIVGAAMFTNYILTIAVSVSSGVEQITSAFQTLIPFRVEIAVGVIILMTIVNLRGLKESGRILAVPTYFFLATIFLTLAIGFFRYFTGTLGTVQDVEIMKHNVLEPLGLFLILRAFSNGCILLTGIETISTSTTEFRQPRSRNAALTLIWISSILITLFLGITFLSHQINAQPSEVETIISQLGRAIFGDHNVMYYIVLVATALILLMASNNSYSNFRRLTALYARDGFLPRQFTRRENRVTFALEKVTLAIMALMFVIFANASTTALLPLYAISAFLIFTISQLGLVVRLFKTGKLKLGEVIKDPETDLEYDSHWRTKMILSGLGTFCAGIVFLTFVITKFASGAWFMVILIPVLAATFLRINYHYTNVANSLNIAGVRPETDKRPVQTIILVDDVHAETVRMINFANSLNSPWQAIHVDVNPEKARIIARKWQEQVGDDNLVIIDSPYQLLAEPIQDYIEYIQREKPGCLVHVIMEHLVVEKFWQQVLHRDSAFIFNQVLGHMEDVFVTIMPYQIPIDTPN